MTKSEQWQQYVDAWQKSGLSQATFCKQHELVLHNFQYWRKRLRSAADNAETSIKTSKLIPVHTLRSTLARVQLFGQVEVQLPTSELPELLCVLKARGLLSC